MTDIKNKVKLDYELIKKILEEVKEKGNGVELKTIECKYYLDPERKTGEYFKPCGHYDILFSNNFMDGFVWMLCDCHDASIHDPNIDRFNIRFRGLTDEGQKILDIMQNDVVWKQIKNDVIEMAQKGIMQISALALTVNHKSRADLII